MTYSLNNYTKTIAQVQAKEFYKKLSSDGAFKKFNFGLNGAVFLDLAFSAADDFKIATKLVVSLNRVYNETLAGLVFFSGKSVSKSFVSSFNYTLFARNFLIASLLVEQFTRVGLSFVFLSNLNSRRQFAFLSTKIISAFRKNKLFLAQSFTNNVRNLLVRAIKKIEMFKILNILKALHFLKNEGNAKNMAFRKP